MLFGGKEELSSQKQCQLFFKEEETIDDAYAYNGGNSELVLRYGYSQESKVFELKDIFDIDKYLINGVDFYIKLFS